MAWSVFDVRNADADATWELQDDNDENDDERGLAKEPSASAAVHNGPDNEHGRQNLYKFDHRHLHILLKSDRFGGSPAATTQIRDVLFELCAELQNRCRWR